jgi:hypothetical protein
MRGSDCGLMGITAVAAATSAKKRAVLLSIHSLKLIDRLKFQECCVKVNNSLNLIRLPLGGANGVVAFATTPVENSLNEGDAKDSPGR